MKNISKFISQEIDDPIQRLAMAIVYSGVVEKDAKFFCSDWAKAIFKCLDIQTDPLDWYLMILEKKGT